MGFFFKIPKRFRIIKRSEILAMFKTFLEKPEKFKKIIPVLFNLDFVHFRPSYGTFIFDTGLVSFVQIFSYVFPKFCQEFQQRNFGNSILL